MQDQSNAQDEHSSMCAAPSSKRDPGVTTSTLKTELASAQTSLLRLTQQIESLELSSTITDPMGTYSADVISTLTDFVLCVLNPRKTAISKSSFEKLMQESRFTNIKPLLQPMISQLMDRDSEVADSTPVFSSEAGNKSESACHLPAINASKSILLSRSPDLLASNINSPTDSTLNTELKKSISEIKKIRQMSRTKSTKCLNTASSARSLGTIQMSVSVQTENADKTVNNADIESQMRDLRHTIDNLNIERESLKHSMSKLESYSNGLKAIIEEGKKKIQALELAKTARDKEIELLADELGKLRIVQR
ncbi:hypothetical protein BKA69DRAFT_1071346 [Paraphysoderma sedebokerense]|nr:hypothetical protein BKA69DRAFT_1071346 [Paraphysoderma sedebokerense]